MNKPFIYLVVFCFSVISYQLNSVECINGMIRQEDLLSNLSQRYITFINKIGSGGDNQGDTASALFAPSCKKNFNGRWVAEDREAFVTDLLSVYKTYGSWQLIPLEIIGSPENNRIILRIIIDSLSFGKNTAIVLLRYNSNYLIDEIVEVFSPLQEGYEFNVK